MGWQVPCQQASQLELLSDDASVAVEQKSRRHEVHVANVEEAGLQHPNYDFVNAVSSRAAPTM